MRMATWVVRICKSPAIAGNRWLCKVQSLGVYNFKSMEGKGAFSGQIRYGFIARVAVRFPVSAVTQPRQCEDACAGYCADPGGCMVDP